MAALKKSEEFTRALGLVRAGVSPVFITGQAGTGKSTLLEHLKKKSDKELAVLAPTGVAALNVGGQTIHSFFGFAPDITPHEVKRRSGKRGELYRKLELVIIDEISMVRADLLDSIDAFLRLNRDAAEKPFGGVQMVFVGDLYQLPPVVPRREEQVFASSAYRSPYFFDAWALEDVSVVGVELERVFRQKDPNFVRVLHAVRTNTATRDDIALLNTRHLPDAESVGDAPHLTATNALADAINADRLARITGKSRVARATAFGEVPRDLPVPDELELKVGAQVMLVVNDREDRWVNGDIGVVRSIPGDEEDGDLIVELRGGREVRVERYAWETYRYTVEEETGKVVSQVIGTYRQYPLRLAWAVTIHKSQGKTLDRVTIDVGRGTFAHGQLYVALSRCTTLEGITLVRPIERRHIITDERVTRFMRDVLVKK